MYFRYDQIPALRALTAGQRENVLRQWRRSRLPLTIPLITALVLGFSFLFDAAEAAWPGSAPRSTLRVPFTIMAVALLMWPLHVWGVNALAQRTDLIQRWKDAV